MMEARLSKPVGGLMGEEVTVTATSDEWAVIAAVLDGTPDCAALADDMVDLLQSVGVTY